MHQKSTDVGDEAEKSLLPGLPQHLAGSILARLPLPKLSLLQVVSRTWRQALKGSLGVSNRPLLVVYGVTPLKGRRRRKVITYPYMAQGVYGHFTKKPEEIGAGDQGHMIGYAINETDQELMPLVHVLATKLGAMLTKVRKNGTCEWLP
ncbi:hypothetical protein L7F22_025413 [Adiantum nelumboides]|nr:hypothetical protein [Adiantum nelumboides]